jgi:hypothetical protein
MDIPVRIVDHRPIATLRLNGTEVPMLVDSGAFFSMLTASTASQLKLPLHGLPFGFRVGGYTGQIAAKRTRVERLGLAGAELKDIEFIVGGNELGAGIMGVLGRNILSVADTEYARAKKAFDGAIELQALPSSLYGRGLALLQLNETASGERDLAAARKLEPMIDDKLRKLGFEFVRGVKPPSVPGS